jgi:hypothetical protein
VLGGLQLHLRQSHLVAAGARWLGSHTWCFAFLAGIPAIVVRVPALKQPSNAANL